MALDKEWQKKYDEIMTEKEKDKKIIHLEKEIDKLAKFILKNYSTMIEEGSAVDNAIRIIEEQDITIGLLKTKKCDHEYVYDTTIHRDWGSYAVIVIHCKHCGHIVKKVL